MQCCTQCKPDPSAEKCWKNGGSELECSEGKHYTDDNGHVTTVVLPKLVVTRNYYHNVQEQYKRVCSPCPVTSLTTRLLEGAIVIAALALLGPLIVKLGDVLSKAGDVTAPLMTIVTFFQTLDLLKELHVSWPQGVKDFFNALSSWLSLLSFNIEMFHAECTFAITFEQQWLLQLLSPFAFAAILFLCLGFFWASARAAEYMHSHPKVWKRCCIVMALAELVDLVT
eukprot:COSAG01_NODE_11247_length_1973_cov_1.139808_2_plen_226_part_00